MVVWGAAKAARTICGSRCGLIVSLSSGGGGGVPALPETNIFIVWWRVEADEGGRAEPPTHKRFHQDGSLFRSLLLFTQKTANADLCRSG